MTVRVVRILEYIYPDEETAIADMARWQVQNGTYHPRGLGNPMTITSAVLPLTLLQAEERQDTPAVHPFEQEHSAASPFCGALVLRNGHGEPCGQLRTHSIHRAVT